MYDSPRRRRDLAGRHVEHRIHQLLGADAAQVSATAAAQLAQLRRGVGREPGAIPALWAMTFEGLESHTLSDEPTREENAVHHALTLFAVHQQSRPVSMHDASVPFGAAVRRLASATALADRDLHESATYHRFTMLATAATLTELSHHARGLVGQLRQHSIPLDYAGLADDLAVIQRPGRAAAVRRRWARDFFWAPNPADQPIDPVTEGATS